MNPKISTLMGWVVALHLSVGEGSTFRLTGLGRGRRIILIPCVSWGCDCTYPGAGPTFLSRRIGGIWVLGGALASGRVGGGVLDRDDVCDFCDGCFCVSVGVMGAVEGCHCSLS